MGNIKDINSILVGHAEELKFLAQFGELNVTSRTADGKDFVHAAFVRAVAYLIERFKATTPDTWKQSCEALLKLYRSCAENEDFLPAAEFYMKIRGEHIKIMLDEIEAAPEGRYKDKMSLNFALTYENSLLKEFRKYRDEGWGKVKINSIPNPPDAELPNWLLELVKSQWDIGDLVRELEKRK